MANFKNVFFRQRVTHFFRCLPQGVGTKAAASKDLVDGVTVKCTYTYSSGNAANLHRGGGGASSLFFSVLMANSGMFGGGSGGYDSDDYPADY